MTATVGVLAVAGLLASSCGGDDFEKTAEGFNIEPASEVGPHAFTPSVASEDVESAMGAAGGEGEQAAAAGGGACDTDQFLKELQERPDAYREWARVLGIPSADVPAYVQSLTSVTLTEDTKVTNHGLQDGKAYPRQSVLVAGTAVLVQMPTADVVASTTSSSMPAANAPGGGVIVTRCKCGNPLLPAGDPKAEDEETPGTEPPGTTPGSVPEAVPGSSTSTTRSSSSTTGSTSTTRSSTSTTGASSTTATTEASDTDTEE